jgi:hypothetical protein
VPAFSQEGLVEAGKRRHGGTEDSGKEGERRTAKAERLSPQRTQSSQRTACLEGTANVNRGPL